jgi:hypothetical protein
MLKRLSVPETVETRGRHMTAAVRRLDRALRVVRQSDGPPASPICQLQPLPTRTTLRPKHTPNIALTNIHVSTQQVTRVPVLAKPRRFPVASIDLSRADVGLPYGIPRWVNAATLKALAGGKPFDRLLKKTPSGWAFVADQTMVDLADKTVEFKLGQLTIFS